MKNRSIDHSLIQDFADLSGTWSPTHWSSYQISHHSLDIGFQILQAGRTFKNLLGGIIGHLKGLGTNTKNKSTRTPFSFRSPHCCLLSLKKFTGPRMKPQFLVIEQELERSWGWPNSKAFSNHSNANSPSFHPQLPYIDEVRIPFFVVNNQM